MTTHYVILAYYHLVSLENPRDEVTEHKKFLADLDVRARLYISEQGFNGQMSASKEAASLYTAWMEERFPGIVFKRDEYPEHAFPRLTIKYRKQLVAMDREVDLSQTGEHVSPERWKQMLDRQEADIVLDVRNEYEWKVGRFAGSVVPPCDSFREFPAYVEELKKQVDPEEGKVMMYCTGGIRCEFYSALLKDAGFHHVYQLDGGVIQYGHQVGGAHWEGKLFVFDDRMVAPISEEPSEVVGRCHTCGEEAEQYYNCANMDCNDLFISCESCLESGSGCCSERCLDGKRVRPLSHQNPGKPFRKWYHYSADKKCIHS